MDKDLILTCDAGTTGCKCTIISPTGEAISSVRRSYPTSYPQPNWAEQSPEVILSAVYDGIRELLQQVSSQRIACVGLSGTMNGCIPMLLCQGSWQSSHNLPVSCSSCRQPVQSALRKFAY